MIDFFHFLSLRFTIRFCPDTDHMDISDFCKKNLILKLRQKLYFQFHHVYNIKTEPIMQRG